MSHYIFCRRCGAAGPHMGNVVRSEREAIEAWNRRAPKVADRYG